MNIFIFTEISEQIMNQISKKTELNLSQIRLLTFFNTVNNQLLPMNELAKGLEISLSTLSRQLKQEKTKSFIQIELGSKDSTKLIQLNELGQQQMYKLLTEIATIKQKIFSYWDEKAQATLNSELSMISKRLNSLD